MKKRFISALLALCMAFSLLPVSAFAADGTGTEGNAEVSSETELRAAINAGNSSITLKNNIQLTSSLTIASGTVTINGGDHTISLADSFTGTSLLSVTGGTLTICNTTFSGSFSKNGTNWLDYPLIYAGTGSHLTLDTCIIDGGLSDAVADRSCIGLKLENATAVLDSSTIQNCYTGNNGGAGVRLSGGSLEMTNSTIQNCVDDSWTGTGGGVWVSDNAILKMNSSSQISGCKSKMGGGVYISYGSLMMDSSTIDNCTATGGSNSSGGGVCVGGSSSNGSLVMNNNSKIINCTAASYGGGVYVYGSSSGKSSLTMTDSSIEQCHSYGSKGSSNSTGGGGVCLRGDHAGMTMTGSKITGCTSAFNGGGVSIDGSSAEMTMEKSSSIESCNASGYGGGVAVCGASAKLNMDLSSIESCTASVNGGGVYLSGSSALMTATNDCTIDHCDAKYGGGISLSNGGADLRRGDQQDAAEVKITNCHASASGGGIYINAHTDNSLDLSSSKIYNNTAVTSGDDLAASPAIKNYSIQLPVYTDKKLTYIKDNAEIDGWYSDASNARYDQTKHVDSVDDTYHHTVEVSRAQPRYLVASHAVYDIVFDGESSDSCHAYADSSCGQEITVAAAGQKVYLTYADNGALRDGLTADQCIGWDAVTGAKNTEGSTPVRVIGAEPSASFTMPKAPVEGKVTITPKAMLRSDIDNGSDPVQPDVPPTDDSDGSGSIAGVIIGGVAVGSAVYLVGTDAWLRCLYGFIPENRIQLALALWNRADCPEPESTELYPDIDEDDTDAQKAARWCVEQQLMKDYRKQNDDGTETVTFKPYRYVFRPYALTRWYELEKLLNEQQPAEATAETESSTGI